MKNLSISVIIAAHNERRHLGECLGSLRGQSRPPLEIIVVDDGSTDGTADVARSCGGVTVLRRRHEGKARAVNAGAQKATGDVLVFLDGDMFFNEDYLARLTEPLLGGDELGTCHADERVANPDNVWSACWQERAGLRRGRRLNLSEADLAEGSIVYRAVFREAFLKAGGFDDTGYLDDQTLFPKLGRRARFVPEAVCHHYNPETLGEVFASGRWAGKSIALRHGNRALFRYGPWCSLFRSAAEGWKFRCPAQAVYGLAYDAGVVWALAALATGITTHHGR